MHAAVCLLRAGQPRSASDAAKLGQFIGQFSWVTGDPIGVKGLIDLQSVSNQNKKIIKIKKNFLPILTHFFFTDIIFIGVSCCFSCTTLCSADNYGYIEDNSTLLVSLYRFTGLGKHSVFH